MSKDISVQFFQSASKVLKILGHPIRLKIIKFLESGGKSVGQIQRYLSLAQPVTSQHLRHMYSKGIVNFRRDGTTYYYSIANEFIHKIQNCVSECQEKIKSGEWRLDIFEMTSSEE